MHVGWKSFGFCKNQNLVCSPQAFALCILLLHWIEGQFNLEEDLWIKSYSHLMPHAHAETVGYVFHHIHYSMPATQDTDWIEVYAGQANCTKCIRYANYRGVKFDLLYSKFRKDGNKNKSDYMNILDPSGFLFLGQISTVNIQSMHAPSLFSPPQLWVICSQVSVHLCAQRPLLQWLRGNGSHEMQHDGACQFRD